MVVSWSVVPVSGWMTLPLFPLLRIHHLQNLAVIRSSLRIKQRILFILISMKLTISLRTTELS